MSRPEAITAVPSGIDRLMPTESARVTGFAPCHHETWIPQCGRVRLPPHLPWAITTRHSSLQTYRLMTGRFTALGHCGF